MKEKFTKGEWVVYQGDIRWCQNKVCIIEEDGGPTVVADGNFYFKKDERIANAHLIAASPDMYSMLNDIHGLLGELDKQTHPSIEIDVVQHEIETLLAKARGEQCKNK